MWGILLILVAAVLEFAYQPDAPWVEVLGATFGIGAALTLDEFALWVHLDDVYWSTEGRKSIDAIVVAACIGAALLIGTAPFGVDDNVSQEGLAWVAITVLITIALAFIAVLKGKLAFGLIGLFVFPFAFFGAIRLAKPDSPWARRRYGPVRRSWPSPQRRYGERRQARIDRLRDLLGGTRGSAGADRRGPQPAAIMTTPASARPAPTACRGPIRSCRKIAARAPSRPGRATPGPPRRSPGPRWLPAANMRLAEASRIPAAITSGHTRAPSPAPPPRPPLRAGPAAPTRIAPR